jgi:Tuberculosis necrotizing toxin
MTPRRLMVAAVLACLLSAGPAALPIPLLRAGTALAASEAAGQVQCSTRFLDGDRRLGPEVLPDHGVVGLELRGYWRFAGLTRNEFLTRYWDPSAGGGAGGWRYPRDNGFVIGPNGHPVEAPEQLWPGLRIDRYGRATGQFLAPFGALYAQRAIPPSNLDNDPPHSCDYHAYVVLRAFRVQAGPAAPAFGQPGWALQYLLDSSLIDGAPDRLTVAWLVTHAYLRTLM